MSVERVLRAYKHGHLSDFELFIELGQRISAANADAVLSSLPSNVMDILREQASQMTEPGWRIIGSNLTREAAELQEAKVNAAIPIIREWCAAHCSKS